MLIHTALSATVKMVVLGEYLVTLPKFYLIFFLLCGFILKYPVMLCTLYSLFL